ncbi:hypothetical protein BDBG_04077 [Blastomyces gilchristii SLH14081]|uniref:Integral membrane protein n=1 Tax=Blastomyces gilchristii (strain SLH14081) TaxID=559298 RepID=A0A179UJC0_BLAGS|nr:uncharacterized protein BDBG_04077 [Blastomyces gilchristii SLH14081]OAT08084.1 hypothetical protein BDBG_04077 [Blastomyces gilchristii SLH14081]
MWLMIWPIAFWAAAVMLASSLFYIQYRVKWLRTEAILSIIFVLLNFTVIVFLGYQWVSYELDFDELNRRHPHIINTQCIISHVIFFSSFGISVIGCASYFFVKRLLLPSRKHHINNSKIQMLLCAFAMGSAWMVTYPSSQAKDSQDEFRELLESGKHEELRSKLRGLANLHIGLEVFAWPMVYAGLYAFARALRSIKSRASDCFFKASLLRHGISTPPYSPRRPYEAEYGDLQAEFFGNSALVQLKSFDQHPMVRPLANATRHPPRNRLVSLAEIPDLRLPPPAFLGDQSFSPGLVSIDTFVLDVPWTTPCSRLSHCSIT